MTTTAVQADVALHRDRANMTMIAGARPAVGVAWSHAGLRVVSVTTMAADGTATPKDIPRRLGAVGKKGRVHLVRAAVPRTTTTTVVLRAVAAGTRMMIAAPRAAAAMMTTAGVTVVAAEAAAAGLATLRDIPKPRGRVGKIRITARAAGMATAAAIRRLRAADGTIPITARAAGMATPRATPRLRVVAGRAAETRAAGDRTTMTNVDPRALAVVTTTTTIAAAVHAVVAAAGLAIRKGTRRPHAAVGRTAVNSASELRSQ